MSDDYRKAERLLGEPISDVRRSLVGNWTGPLIGGGKALAAMHYDPLTRALYIHSRPPSGEIDILIRTSA